ncbi:ABC transporter permease [Pseudoclavibacter sp. CFCC 11306]|uniref:ABC transporter permease n=1 Tax=Pseudoclavibacter sp. CFCC 11306 TaxID=1564493 RepID=UPI001300FF88|nr:ABC transporter permease [Pseudoclavibacter sp. CFCC 11306]KAB1656972.1 ABC transporter permease [Pseudoclavibacter sp. CFCC 11306]
MTTTAQRPRTRTRRFEIGWEVIVATVIIAVIAVAGLIVWLLPGLDSYATTADPFLSPSAQHLLGTDNIGRDSFTRLASASLTSLLISLSATVIAGVIGVTVGFTAAYLEGPVASVIMRFVDVGLAIPGILLALTIRVILGAGTPTLILSLGVLFAPSIARIAYGAAHEIRHRAYVQAAELDNVSGVTIVVRHLLPNAATPVSVQLAATAAAAVALEAALSYLGQGIQPPNPSIGQMVQEFGQYIQSAPLLFVGPIISLVLMSVAWNLLSDGLRRGANARSIRE